MLAHRLRVPTCTRRRRTGPPEQARPRAANWSCGCPSCSGKASSRRRARLWMPTCRRTRATTASSSMPREWRPASATSVPLPHMRSAPSVRDGATTQPSKATRTSSPSVRTSRGRWCCPSSVRCGPRAARPTGRTRSDRRPPAPAAHQAPLAHLRQAATGSRRPRSSAGSTVSAPSGTASSETESST